MPERRQFERFKVAFPVTVEYDSGQQHNEERTKLINLCAGGALFISRADLDRGAEIDLGFTAPAEIADGILGLGRSGGEKDLVFRCSAVVVRREKRLCIDGYKDAIAVEFNGPLRIADTPNAVN